MTEAPVEEVEAPTPPPPPPEEPAPPATEEPEDVKYSLSSLQKKAIAAGKEMHECVPNCGYCVE